MFKGLFDTQTRFAKIDRNGDPLKKLNDLVDWTIFLPDLSALEEKTGGRPPYSALLKFKMLILQSLYNLSDDSLEQQVLDRLSFMRFLGLGMGDNVPDAKTIWAFRETLKKLGLVEKLFSCFNAHLNQAGFSAQHGQIVDASIVRVPTRHDSSAINDKIKSGEDIEEWKPATRAQKDVNARWTRKNNKSYFGYKNHVAADVKFKLIRAYAVTDASTADTCVFESLLQANSDPSLYADSAYNTHERIQQLHASSWLPCLHERANKHHPLSESQLAANRERSRIRARVEHVFGAQLQRAGNLILRTIGIARAKVKIGLRNLAYNLERYSCLVSQNRGIVS
jgi:IS5 family transposase